ncbi:MmgE/PrpD family protein [Devosia sp.]|uniref:MmgE/PrpD family protein n=1 Tax=Devosia sp. TaxID=1871048 RepID=UPI0035B1369A
MLVHELASWAVAVREIDLPARRAVSRVITDAIAAAVAGMSVGGSRAAAAAAADVWGDGDVPIWFAGAKASLPGAVFANATAASILDLDDGHRAAAGHPGAAIVPAVLGAAHAMGASDEQALVAVAIGYEIGIRIAAARDLRAVDTLITARWCGQGVAAAIGWLKGRPSDEIAEAIAIAGAVAPHMLVAEYTQVGNHTKEAIPFGAVNGVAAARLAEAGFKGPTDILDNPAYFDADRLRRGGADGRLLVETAYFKPYSCCRWAHAPIDAMLELVDEKLDWRAIDKIEVHTFARTLTLNNQPHPQTIQAAQYSVPFCVAASAVGGIAALQPMTEDLLGNAEVHALAERVTLIVDPDLDAAFPAAVPGRLVVSTGAQQYVRDVSAPKGEATNPMSWAELTGKLRTVGRARLEPSQLEALLEAVEQLQEEGKLARLYACLARGCY